MVGLAAPGPTDNLDQKRPARSGIGSQPSGERCRFIPMPAVGAGEIEPCEPVGAIRHDHLAVLVARLPRP
jgi:hypothetical protein